MAMSTPEAENTTFPAALRRAAGAATGDPSGGGQDDAGLALFRHAVVDRSESGWRELTSHYRVHVLDWCRTADCRANSEALAAAAWETFRRHCTPAKLERAGATAEALRYLKMCVWSAATEESRARLSAALQAEAGLSGV